MTKMVNAAHPDLRNATVAFSRLNKRIFWPYIHPFYGFIKVGGPALSEHFLLTTAILLMVFMMKNQMDYMSS